MSFSLLLSFSSRVVDFGVDRVKADQGVAPCEPGWHLFPCAKGDTDIQGALSTLQLNFELLYVIAKELLNTGVRNLEEFRFLFEDEVKIGTWVSKFSLGDATAIQTARLRRAWTACNVYFQQVEQDRSKVVLADLDSLLEDSELRDVKTQF